MIEHDTKIKDANVLVMGLTFKENCPDIRNSKVIDIIKELKEFGVNVLISDPLAKYVSITRRDSGCMISGNILLKRRC